MIGDKRNRKIEIIKLYLKFKHNQVQKLIYIILVCLVPVLAYSQTDSSRVLELQAKLAQAKHDTAKINLLLKLASELFNSNVEQSINYTKTAIDLSLKNEYMKGLADSYQKLGVCFYYDYKLDSTLYYYNKSLEIYEELKDQNGIASIFKNIGLIYYMQSKYNEALDYYNRSLTVSINLKDAHGIAECRNDIGAVYYNLGNYEKALDNYFEGLRISEELGEKDVVIVNLNNIGGIYEAQEKYDRALPYYFKANKLAEENGNMVRVADTYQNIGIIYSQTQKFDSAIIIYEDALKIYQQLNDKRGIMIVYNFFGQVYSHAYEVNPTEENKIKLEKGEEFYLKSKEINKQEINDPAELCSSYQGLGEISIFKKEYKKAIGYLTEALNLATQIESTNNIRMAHDKLSKAYAGIGDYKKAYESHVLFQYWNDSLKNDQNIELITQMSMQYSFDKEQGLKDLEYQQKLKRQRLVRYFILIVLLIVSGFSVQVFRSYQQKKKDNVLLAHQKEEIEKQKEEITDSIKYAKRIQNAILPSFEYAKEILPEHFILFRPRDIVSGDYYWMHRTGNILIVAAADCTGHGVPGAFMSMLGVSFLNEIVHKENLLQPHLILNKLRESVKRTLGQTGKEGEAKDGMDIAMVVVNFDTMILQYAGAYNPLYLYRNGELIETKADKMPIGIYIKEKESFTNNEMPIQKGDTFYIFSDGYHDQFGGKDGGKYKSIPFKNYLASIQSYTMAEQRELLNTNIDNWKGNLDQTDDIIVIGVRI